MKLGVKEFRERFSELADGQEPVLVTKNGRVVGTYQPGRTREQRVRDWTIADQEIQRIVDEWRETTPDWVEHMASVGLDPNGDPLPECD